MEPVQKKFKRDKKCLRPDKKCGKIIVEIFSPNHAGPEKKIIKVLPIIEESVKLFRPFIPSSIDIKFNIPEDSSSINTDPTQIHQVLINLGTNASQSMENEGGVLEIGLSEIDLERGFRVMYQELNPDRYVLLTLKDTGLGIDPSIMERIFDPYSTTQEQGESAGMGLTVIHSIVKSYQGEISVESLSGLGTTFKVYIPVSVGEIFLEERVEQKPPAGMGKILFVDDDESLVEMGSLILEKFEYEVVTRTNPLEDLELFNQIRKFDAVVTDMTMPMMEGNRLFKEIFKSNPDYR
jgi:two-component system, cell cycle sensor histidine kinase and response regulator CckA